MSVWKATTDASSGRTYYFNTATRETTWTKPEDFDATPAPATPATPQQHDSAAIDAAWKEAPPTADGRVYYYNKITNETRWQPPEGFVPQQQQNNRQAPSFVAGGQHYGGDDYAVSDRRHDRRGDRDHGLPQKPSFDDRRGGGVPWEQRQEPTGFRGPMPVKTDEPEFATHEQAEEAFFKLLRKHNISPDSTWEDALREVVREKEYRALKDPKERKQAFEKYCVEARAQEKGKEKERRAKLREDFLKMLSTHEEIKHYTRWKTARPMIEREAVFRSAGNDDERRQIFDEYIFELKKKNAEKEMEDRKNAMQQIETLLQALITDPNTKWNEAEEAIYNNERFRTDGIFRALTSMDILRAFDDHIKALDYVANDSKQTNKRMRVRRERQARDSFRQLLQQMRSQGKIKAGTKWSEFHPLVAQDERYLHLVGVTGSSPLDLFWDILEEEERDLRGLRNDALDVLEDRRYEMTLDTTLDEFADVMRSDPKTGKLNHDQVKTVYGRLMSKIKKRAEDDRANNERSQRKAVDALRSAIKHLEPPVRLSDSYEDVAARLEGYEEYRMLDNEARKAAYDKHIRRLKEKDEDFERDRPRRDRDRDRSRREGDRDRDRRHHTRTPEVDAYEADRRQAQAARERQYRKASFGLTPPPRDRRDDRDDRYRRHDRHDRHDPMSVYDRERREREMERERSYISRADPRDRGKTLDYGDEDAGGSRPDSTRKRRESDDSLSARREAKVNHLFDPALKAPVTNSIHSDLAAVPQSPSPRCLKNSTMIRQPYRAEAKRVRLRRFRSPPRPMHL